MRAAFAVIGVATLCRMVFALLLGIGPDEAYAWICAGRWAPAFFDGPGGTAGVVAGLQGVLSLEGIRMLWPLWAAAASWFLWRLAGALFEGRTALSALVVWSLLPAVNLSATTVSPAMPALALVLAAVFFVRQAWTGSARAWIPAGLCFGGAAVFRYEAVLVFSGVAMLFAAIPRQRRRVNAIGLLWAFGATVAALAAPMAWNAALEWVPLARGTPRSWISFEWALAPAALAGGGVGVIGAGFLVACGGLALLVARESSKARFLVAISTLPVLWWTFRGLHGDPALFAALAGSTLLLPAAAARLSGRQALVFVAAVLLASASIHAGWKESTERREWPELAAAVRDAAGELPAGDQSGFFIAEDAALASMLGYLLAPQAREKYPPVFVPEGPDIASQFALWPSYSDFEDAPQGADEFFTEQKGVNPFVGRHALYIGHELPQTVEAAFESVALLREVRGPGGKPLLIFLCLNYQTLPL